MDLVLNNLQRLICHKTQPTIWPIDRILSAATTQGQIEPGSNSTEEVLHIPQKLQGWSLAIRLFSVLSRTLIRDIWESYPTAEMQPVYSTALANWAVHLNFGINFTRIHFQIKVNK